MVRSSPRRRANRACATRICSRRERAVDDADRGFIVAGPTNRPTPAQGRPDRPRRGDWLSVLADPLSGVRFGGPRRRRHGLWRLRLLPRRRRRLARPDVVLRFGASPTSKALRRYLRDADCRQYVVDPAGAWREAEFTATDLVTADPTGFAEGLAARVSAADATETDWTERFARAERAYWDLVGPERDGTLFEGAVAGLVVASLPDPATLYVSTACPSGTWTGSDDRGLRTSRSWATAAPAVSTASRQARSVPPAEPRTRSSCCWGPRVLPRHERPARRRAL